MTKSALVFSPDPMGAWFSVGRALRELVTGISLGVVHSNPTLRTALHHHIIYHNLCYEGWITYYNSCIYSLCIYHLKQNTAIRVSASKSAHLYITSRLCV